MGSEEHSIEHRSKFALPNAVSITCEREAFIRFMLLLGSCVVEVFVNV